MKTIRDKYLVVGADFAGFPLKEAVVKHLKEKGWCIEDLGVTAESDPDDTENMFHRVGLRVGAKISEGEYERALLFRIVPYSRKARQQYLGFFRAAKLQPLVGGGIQNGYGLNVV